MSADELEVNGSGSERNRGYQAVAVALDIENKTLIANIVGRTKRLPHGRPIGPLNASYVVVPFFEGCFGIGMRQRKSTQHG